MLKGTGAQLRFMHVISATDSVKRLAMQVLVDNKPVVYLEMDLEEAKNHEAALQQAIQRVWGKPS